MSDHIKLDELDEILDDVRDEYEESVRRFGMYKSAYEAIAFIEKAFEDLKYEVFKQRKDAVKHKAAKLSAMTIKLIAGIKTTEGENDDC